MQDYWTMFWLIVTIGATIWVGVDASKRDWKRPLRGRKRFFCSNTFQWTLGSALFWLIVFPIYLAQRNDAPLKTGA
jgi:hypothetical protein